MNLFTIWTNQKACVHSFVQCFHLVQVQRGENHTSLIIPREQFHPIGTPRQRCDGALMDANYIETSQLEIQRKRENMMVWKNSAPRCPHQFFQLFSAWCFWPVTWHLFRAVSDCLLVCIMQYLCWVSHLLVSTRKWRHQLEDCNSSRCCSYGNQIVETTKQFHGCDGVTSALETHTDGHGCQTGVWFQMFFLYTWLSFIFLSTCIAREAPGECGFIGKILQKDF